ncbi:MAG TPA: hypothetical protein DDW43_06340 [Nitrosomonas sp.]|uniref:Uncharacterized protein n=1 Tax=Nitrosomonas europaea (strain ATCC 19718 / CIP 103999 / KCTC 2705 / NBRC 14298) TaxID=228410 RepID=Q82V55_NITEU|nr:hypothetical protein [Nitrosomonas sp. PRO5]CAD85157.1 hypothetical protein NE1246 [Nitrosomonas europaea ATCC 19718]HBF25099.1 hypothetical protein [Nitrosomonas sp.]
MILKSYSTVLFCCFLIAFDSNRYRMHLRFAHSCNSRFQYQLDLFNCFIADLTEVIFCVPICDINVDCAQMPGQKHGNKESHMAMTMQYLLTISK